MMFQTYNCSTFPLMFSPFLVLILCINSVKQKRQTRLTFGTRQPATLSLPHPKKVSISARQSLGPGLRYSCCAVNRFFMANCSAQMDIRLWNPGWLPAERFVSDTETLPHHRGLGKLILSPCTERILTNRQPISGWCFQCDPVSIGLQTSINFKTGLQWLCTTVGTSDEWIATQHVQCEWIILYHSDILLTAILTDILD